MGEVKALLWSKTENMKFLEKFSWSLNEIDKKEKIQIFF